MNFVSEPNISGKLTYLRNPTKEIHNVSDLDEGSLTFKPGNSDGGYYDTDQNGDFLKVDYTGFQNAYYYDMHGNKHTISRITVTYSNLKIDSKFQE